MCIKENTTLICRCFQASRLLRVCCLFFREFRVLIFRTGPNKWRDTDSITPCVILDNYCEQRNLSKPRYSGDTQVRVDSKNYTLDEFGEFFFPLALC